MTSGHQAQERAETFVLLGWTQRALNGFDPPQNILGEYDNAEAAHAAAPEDVGAWPSPDQRAERPFVAYSVLPVYRWSPR